MRIKIRRKKKIQKEVKWLLSHPDEFFLICGVGKEKMTEEKFTEMYNLLRKEKFEVLFSVLITVHHEIFGIAIE